MDSTTVLSAVDCARLIYKRPKCYAIRTFPDGFQQHSEQRHQEDRRKENLCQNVSITNDESKTMVFTVDKNENLHNNLKDQEIVSEPQDNAINPSTELEFHRQTAGGLNADSSSKTPPPRTRKVSCVRSFPPNCGIHAPNPAEEDNVET